MDVPLREESVPVSGIRVRFSENAPRRFRVEPGSVQPVVRQEGETTVVDIPPLDVHAMLVGEMNSSIWRDPEERIESAKEGSGFSLPQE